MTDRKSNPDAYRVCADPRCGPLLADIRDGVADIKTDVAVMRERLSACRARSDEYHAVVEKRIGAVEKTADEAVTPSKLQKWWPILLGALALLGGGGASTLVRALQGGDTTKVLDAIKAERKLPKVIPVPTPVPVPTPKADEE